MDDSEERGGWSIRKKEEEKRRKQQIDATRVLYRCTACNHTCLRLARPLSEMPVRKTDGTRVVDAANDLVYLAVVKGGVKLLKREKGIEKQWRYKCELCDVVVGYRPVDYEQDTKYVYIFPEAVHTNKPGVINALPAQGVNLPTPAETSTQKNDEHGNASREITGFGVAEEAVGVDGGRVPSAEGEQRPSSALPANDQKGVEAGVSDQGACASSTGKDGLLPLPESQDLTYNACGRKEPG